MAGCLTCLGLRSRRKRQLGRPDKQRDQDPPIPIQSYNYSEEQAPNTHRAKDLPPLPYNNRSSTIVNVGGYGNDHDQESIPASHDIWITPPMTLPPLDDMSAEERLELARQKAGDERIGRGPLPPKHRRPASPPTSPGVPLTNSTLRALQMSGKMSDEVDCAPEADGDADDDDDDSMVVNNRNSMSTVGPAAKFASTLRAIPDDQSLHSYGDLGVKSQLDNNLSRRMSSGGLSNTSSYSAFTGVTGMTNTTANTSNTFGMSTRYGRKASGGSMLGNNLNANSTRALHPLAESMIPEVSPSFEKTEFQKDPDSESDITTTTANTKAWLESVENPHARPAPFMR